MGKRLTAQDVSEPQEPAAVLHMALLVCRRTRKSCWSKLSGKLLSCLGRSWFPVSESFFILKEIWFIYLIFIWLCPVLVAACGIFRCGIQTFSCITWGSISPTRGRTGSPTLGSWSLGHWTTREVALEAFRESPSGPKSACSGGTQLVGQACPSLPGWLPCP